jgi:hypothetical protein
MYIHIDLNMYTYIHLLDSAQLTKQSNMGTFIDAYIHTFTKFGTKTYIHTYIHTYICRIQYSSSSNVVLRGRDTVCISKKNEVSYGSSHGVEVCMVSLVCMYVCVC